jgi:hypothetical protein
MGKNTPACVSRKAMGERVGLVRKWIFLRKSANLFAKKSKTRLYFRL